MHVAALRLPLFLAVALAACGSSETPASPDAASPDAASPDAASPDVPEADAAPADVTANDVAASDVTAADDATPPQPDVPEATAAMIRARPYASSVPRAYDASRAWPLVVLLHGYGASGAAQSLYFGLNVAFERRGFLLATPDGTPDGSARRFWNATDACCNFARADVDDVAYVTAIVDDMAARYRVDPRRVFVVGHSNGAFMAHRVACERANRVAAVVSLAGAVWSDAARCTPSEAVSVLQVHGTADETILYAGGALVGVAYPSAHDTVAFWGRANGCGALADTRMPVDLVGDLPGAETRVERHAACAGGAAELWSIDGAGHIPTFGPAWSDAIYDWLSAHPKPAR